MVAWTKLNAVLAGKVVAIIGNGPSVSALDLSALVGLPVIGCNDAFRLPGVDVCIWGDTRWFARFKKELQSWSGLKVTCNKKQKASPGIIILPRCYKTIVSGQLAWYGNTGISAIHLAAAAGARGALLFGFDMKGRNGQHHWHEHALSKSSDRVYPLFQRQFTKFAQALRQAYPADTFRVINTNTGSALKVFPRMSLAAARKELLSC